MSKCKHHYVYAFESRVENYDVRLFNDGYTKSTLPKINLGYAMAFYECRKCGEMLLTERLKG